MDITSIIVILLIGGIAGWLAGTFLTGSGFGLPENVVVGILGAIVGSVVFSLLGLLTSGIIGAIIKATVGAVILLLVADFVKRRA